MTPFTYAAGLGRSGALKMMIKEVGSDGVNTTEDRVSTIALKYACLNGQVDCVKTLLLAFSRDNIATAQALERFPQY